MTLEAPWSCSGVVTFSQGYPENEQVIASTMHMKMIRFSTQSWIIKSHHKIEPLDHVGVRDAQGEQHGTTTEEASTLSEIPSRSESL